jgi:hypothetical protein
LEEGLKINVTADVDKALAGLDLVFESVKRFNSISNVSLSGLTSQLERVNASGTSAANALSGQFTPAINSAVSAAKGAEKVLSRIPLYLSPGGNTKDLEALGAAFIKLKSDVGTGTVSIGVQTGASIKNLSDLIALAKQLEDALAIPRSVSEQSALRAQLAATRSEIVAITSSNFSRVFTDATAAMRGTSAASTAAAIALSKIQAALNFSPGNGVRAVADLSNAIKQRRVHNYCTHRPGTKEPY